MVITHGPAFGSDVESGKPGYPAPWSDVTGTGPLLPEAVHNRELGPSRYCAFSEVQTDAPSSGNPALTLRSPRVEDAKALLEVFGDPDAMRYVGDGRTRTLEELRLALERGISLEAERGFNMFVVVRREDGRLLGDCGLSVWLPTGETEIGWRFAKEHWSHGCAYEAAKAVLRFAAEEVGLTRVISVIHPENVTSKRLAERLGFAAEREEEVHGLPVVYYARPLFPPEPISG